MTFRICIWLTFLFYLVPWLHTMSPEVDYDEPGLLVQNDYYQVDFYPTYGYIEGEYWVVPVKYYVYKQRNYLESILTSIFGLFRNLSSEESEIFRSRLQYFTADSESREQVEFVFDHDPEEEKFQLQDTDGETVRTNLNGIGRGNFQIPLKKAEDLYRLQPSESEWLTLRVVSPDHFGKGKIRLIQPEGLSVISDIDDTLKISELPAGSRIAAGNAFFKEYIAAPEMAELFQQWDQAAIHYVSGTPRQFYRPLSEFLLSAQTGFPQGTFHLRNVRKNPLSLNTWRDLEDIISAENVTINHKIEHITQIMQDFPKRDFILVGDSGQHDPDIFREVREMYPEQIREIFIRDIINDRKHNPERLEGMTVIPAETIVEGVSLFN